MQLDTPRRRCPQARSARFSAVTSPALRPLPASSSTRSTHARSRDAPCAWAPGSPHTRLCSSCSITFPAPGADHRRALRLRRTSPSGDEGHADAHAIRRLHLHVFKRLDLAYCDLGRRILITRRLGRAPALAPRSSTVRQAARSRAQSRSASILPVASSGDRLRVEPLIAAALLHAEPMNDPGHLDLVGHLGLRAPAPLRRLRSRASVVVITPVRLRSFSAYLSNGCPDTKKPQHLFLVGQPLALFPIGGSRRCIGVAASRRRLVEDSKQPALALLQVALRLLRPLHRPIHGRHQLPACAPASPAQPALISDSITRLFITRRSTFSRELPEAVEAPAHLDARFHNRLNRVAADVLHRGQAEANRLSVRRELRAAFP